MGAGAFRAGPDAVQVLVHAAAEEGELAVAEQRHHVLGHALQEVPVVTDHHQRAGPAIEQVLELGQRLDVQVVGRLVEQQHVGLVHEQPEHLDPAPLAAGQIAYPGPLPFRGEAEPFEQLSRGELAVAHLDPQPYLLHRLADPLVRVELGELLGQVGQPNGLTPDDRSVRVQPRAGRTGDSTFPGEPFPG